MWEGRMKYLETIKNVLENKLGDELLVSVDKIEKNDNLFNLGLDSLNVIKLIIGVEEELNVKFYDKDIDSENWKSVENINKLIEERKV